MNTLLTLAALVGFAANSLLCRTALQEGRIGPLEFSIVRLGSGAAALALILLATGRPLPRMERGRVGGAVALFFYMIPFSFSYVSLPVGTGALILFGCVQITMIGTALGAGERPAAAEWAGIIVAIAGLVVLVLPGVDSPSPEGALLMAVAGISWGVYSLRGRASKTALADTTANFGLALIPSLALAGVSSLGGGGMVLPDGSGLLLATASGAIASGAGYAMWYAALPSLSTMQAALVQLAVPVIATAAGTLILGEPLTLRVISGAAMILAGIAAARRAQIRSAGQPDD